MKINLFVQLFVCLGLAILFSCQKEVQPRPVADFTYSISNISNTEKVIYFVNTSRNANRFQWITSGGNALSDENISVSYTENGRYRVSLTAKNDIGEDTKTQSIDIENLVDTGDYLFYTDVGNKGDISVYINGVFKGKITHYYASGTPPCGEQGSVTVTLSPGTYSYTAKSEGLLPSNWSNTIVVVRGQCRSTKLIK